MGAWERFQQFQPSWIALLTTGLTLLVLLVVRRLVTADERHPGRTAFILLVSSLAFHAVSSIVEVVAGARTASNILNFFALVSLAAGIVGTASLLLFDLLLRRVRLHVPHIVRDLVQAVVLFVVLMGILRKSGVNVLSLVTTSAVLTAVIGLALQSTIANLFAGLSLQMDRMLAIGDWIKVGDRVGRIAQINLRATVVVTKDGDSVLVPNSNLIGHEVLNYSRPSAVHACWIHVGFHYRHPPNVVRAALLEAVRGTPGVLADPPVWVGPRDFADSAITYAVKYWIDDFARELQIDGDVRTRIWYAAQRARLEIPFPIRTVLKTEITEDSLTAEKEHEFLERIAALARIDLLASLDAKDREMLARGLRQAGFASGETIIEQGEPGDSLYFIHRGEVAVRLTVDGAVRNVATLKAGDFFGEMSLISGEPRTATCAALSDVSCFVIEHDAFSHLLATKPRLAEEISTQLSRRQVDLAGQREGLSAEARARAMAESESALLARIRGFFHLG